MGKAKSKKRGKGSREKKTGEENKKVSGGEEMTKRGSKEADEGRGGMVEAKRDGQYFLSRSGLTGGSCAGVAKELAEEGEFKTVGISSNRREDKSD